MDLYILRHGPAGERGPAYPDDTLRPLTPEGRLRVSSLARGMRRIGVAPEVLVTSPLARAHETAEIVAAELGREARFHVHPSLAPGASHRAVLRWLGKEAPDAGAALLVGHEPDLGQLVGALITGGAAAAVRMKKGALACVRLPRWDASEGELRFLLEPRHLVRLR